MINWKTIFKNTWKEFTKNVKKKWTQDYGARGERFSVWLFEKPHFVYLRLVVHFIFVVIPKKVYWSIPVILRHTYQLFAYWNERLILNIKIIFSPITRPLIKWSHIMDFPEKYQKLSKKKWFFKLKKNTWVPLNNFLSFLKPDFKWMLNSDLAFKKFANLTERKKMIKSYFRKRGRNYSFIYLKAIDHETIKWDSYVFRFWYLPKKFLSFWPIRKLLFFSTRAETFDERAFDYSRNKKGGEGFIKNLQKRNKILEEESKRFEFYRDQWEEFIKFGIIPATGMMAFLERTVGNRVKWFIKKKTKKIKYNKKRMSSMMILRKRKLDIKRRYRKARHWWLSSVIGRIIISITKQLIRLLAQGIAHLRTVYTHTWYRNIINEQFVILKSDLTLPFKCYFKVLFHHSKLYWREIKFRFLVLIITPEGKNITKSLIISYFWRRVFFICLFLCLNIFYLAFLYAYPIITETPPESVWFIAEIEFFFYYIISPIFFFDFIIKWIARLKKDSGVIYFDLYFDRFSNRVGNLSRPIAKLFDHTIVEEFVHPVDRPIKHVQMKAKEDQPLTSVDEDEYKMGESYLDDKFYDKLAVFFISIITYWIIKEEIMYTMPRRIYMLWIHKDLIINVWKDPSRNVINDAPFTWYINDLFDIYHDRILVYRDLLKPAIALQGFMAYPSFLDTDPLIHFLQTGIINVVDVKTFLHLKKQFMEYLSKTFDFGFFEFIEKKKQDFLDLWYEYTTSEEEKQRLKRAIETPIPEYMKKAIEQPRPKTFDEMSVMEKHEFDRSVGVSFDELMELVDRAEQKAQGEAWLNSEEGKKAVAEGKAAKAAAEANSSDVELQSLEKGSKGNLDGEQEPTKEKDKE